ncbi:phosphatase PAP2 family protein [Natrarchaeobaculum aegyptiacum]|uniref:Phosphoesterase PA-phosphatase n=1 Tax=Natrarchaeobaculum aegyptiacum TaxID=745377 RepID=A0A2Z2HPX6_9EURY|nr:phosphatase PAP2 family protein [Natrarchaeobaculum aegyptiacum]ARS89099.1 phosphoesterase PA-phosphatase [Natrarchaeobaculum aegyptiacum]
MRLEDQSAVVRDAVSPELADAILLVTALGGTTVPMALLGTLFWLASAHRRRVALAIGYAIAGLPLLLAVKAILALPRPPEEALLVPLEVEGYGFPSGHAFAAVVVYGGLVVAFDRIRDWRALAAVAVVVGLVSLSRVALGVHYLGDVVVGIALGIVVLASVVRLTRADPTRIFLLALVVSIPAVALTGGSDDALLGLGGAIGGLLAGRSVDQLPALRSPLEGVVLVGVAGSVTVAIRALESVVGSARPGLVALYAVLVAWIFLAPAVVARGLDAVPERWLAG